MKFFDGVYDKLEIFYIIFLCTSVIAFIIYIILSNNKNKQLLIDEKNILRKNSDTIRINFTNKTISIYDNNYRILKAKYTFLEFKSLIDYKYIDQFNDWLNKVESNSSQKQKLQVGVYLLNTRNSSKKYIKFTLLNFYEKTNEAFANMEELNIGQQFSLKSNTNEFYNSIYKLSGTRKNSLKGTVIVLKVTNMDFLRKRYGNDNANILLGEMHNRIEDLNEEDEVFTTYLQNNCFCIFKKNVSERKHAKTLATSLIKKLEEESVNILNKQVEPALSVAYTIYGEKTYDLRSLISTLIKSLEKTSFKLTKNRNQYIDPQIDNETNNQNREIEKLRDINATADFNITYEPIINTELMNVLGYVVHTRFQYQTESDSFVTVYNAMEKYGMRNDFLNMYYRNLFKNLVNLDTKNYRMVLRVESSHLDIIKSIWLENSAYIKINLVLLLNYEDIIHPKKVIDYKKIIDEFLEMRIKFAILADENMLTIVSNVINSVDMIIFDEFMISKIEANDLKQISIDNIITNTHNNKIKYIAYGIGKYEQAEVLEKLGIDNLVGPYISYALDDLENQEFLKNRSVQALSTARDM